MDEDLKMVDEDAPKVDDRESRELFSPFNKLGMQQRGVLEANGI